MSCIDFFTSFRDGFKVPAAVRHALLAFTFSVITSATVAGPGAHGPNGEHLDGSQAANAPVSSAPRMEAKSELFELVARLSGGELSILIDRFDSNEPVLNASVEVESGSLKAQARYHEDLGDYAVDDPAMLKLLTQPGEHAVVVTVMAGDDSDLLDAVLQVGAGQGEAAAHGHDHAEGAHDDAHAHGSTRWRWAAGGSVVLALGLAAVWRWRRGRAVLARTPAQPGDTA